MDINGFRSGWQQLVDQVRRAARHDDAEDLLQGSIVRMLEREPRAVLKPEAFLVRAAVNRALDEYRRKRHPAHPMQLDAVANMARDLCPLQDEALIARQRLERVRAGLAELSPRTRQVFLMHRLDGMKYREIAETLDISVSAVEKHVAKAAHFLSDWSANW